MENLQHLLEPVNAFIKGDDFFQYHGIVLSTLWIIGSVVAILARKVSATLHALLFFIIDATTAFFLVGAMFRVYPHFQDKWGEWETLKKGHFIGGGVFLIMLVIQHVGGVSTLLKGIKLFGFYVGNFGRILSVFGFVIAKAKPEIIYISGAITIFLLLASTYKVFFAGKKPEKESTSTTAKNSSASPRNKSPKRD